MFNLHHLTTPRMIGEPIGLHHLDLIVPLNRDERFMATLGGVKNAEQTREWLVDQAESWQRDGFGYWLLRDRVTADMVGRGGLRRTLVEDVEEVEIGYGIVPAFWGRGLATELTCACITIGFEQLNLPSIVAFTMTTNFASQRVMQKAGLIYERDIVRADLPHVLYRIRMQNAE